MARVYKRSDIAEDDIFGDIAASAEKALKKVEAVDAQIIKFTDHYKGLLSTSNTGTVEGVNQLVAVSEDLNKQTKETVLLEKEKVKLQQLQTKLQTEEVKAMQQQTRMQQQKAKGLKAVSAEQAMLNEKTRQANELSRAVARFRSAEAGSLQQLEAKMKLVELALNRLTPEQIENTKQGQRYLASLTEIRAELMKQQAAYGKHTLNVGNYKSAYDGLGMSISQLAREMPAFANSVQTGFMAISNNLPMFFDELQKIKMANKELQAQGQPTVSVFKQIAGAVASPMMALNAFVIALTVLGPKIAEWIGGLFEAEGASEKLNKKLEESARLKRWDTEETKRRTDFVGMESAAFVGQLQQLQRTNASSKERSKLISEINAKYGTTLKNLQDEAAFQAQVNREIGKYIQFQIQRYRLEKFNEAIKLNLTRQDKTLLEIQKNGILTAKEISILRSQEAKDLINVADGTINYVRAMELGLDASRIDNAFAGEKIKNLSELQRRLLYYTGELYKAETAIDEYGYKTGEAAAQQKTFNTELKEFDTILARIQDYQDEAQLRFDIAGLADENQLQRIKKMQQDLLDDAVKNAEEQGEVNVDLMDQMIQAEYEVRKRMIEREAAFKKKQNAENLQTEMAQRLKALDEERDELLKQEGLTGPARAKIWENYYKERAKLDEDFKNKQRLNALEEVKIDQEAANQQEQIAVDRDNAINDSNDKVNEALVNGAKKRNEEIAKSDKEATDKAKEEAEKRKEFQDAMVEETLQEMKRISEEQEKMIDQQIANSQKMVDALQAQANAGNIQASQSIAAERRIIAEQMEAKRQAQREQQMLEEIKLLYTATENYVEKGDTVAVAAGKALLQVKGVKVLAKSLMGFFKGTKRTVGEELGAPVLPGRDGHIIRVDGAEKILNPEQSRLTGGATTDEIVNGYLMARSMAVQPKRRMAREAESTDAILIKKLDDLQQTIANKPELSMEFQQFSETLFEFAYKEKRGNNLVVNRYQYRKS
jgi:hypothetical protein